MSRADHLIAARQYAEANALLDRGIEILGNIYQTNAGLDDTATKLAVARIDAERGEAKTAANLKRNVLEARLELYRNPRGEDNCKER
ncbi:MAG TPA: hypothetical protein VFW35_12750 [Sphingomicrobium sp.]|nr:hypothetical protein [Sphingomicrobium sp.]